MWLAPSVEPTVGPRAGYEKNWELSDWRRFFIGFARGAWFAPEPGFEFVNPAT
jgi:hypothetical protein